MLSQAEADNLIAMRKRFLTQVTISLPPGVDQTHELIGDDIRERFFLDLWRGTIRLAKLKFQNRGRKVIILVRLDMNYPAASYGVSPSRKQTLRSKLRGIEPGKE